MQAAADNGANIPSRYTSAGASAPGPDATTLATHDAGAAMACGRLHQVPVLDRYVTTTYASELGRPPSSRELAHWTAFLGGGGRRKVFVHALTSSSAGLENLVAQHYAELLQDPPSATASAAWVAYLRQPGSSTDALDAYLLGSDAFYRESDADPEEFISNVFEAVIDDDPSSTQEADYEGQLRAGVSRLAVAAEVLHTDQYRVEAIATAYGGDPSGDEVPLSVFATWLPHMRAGGDLRPLIDDQLASVAFYDLAISVPVSVLATFA